MGQCCHCTVHLPHQTNINDALKLFWFCLSERGIDGNSGAMYPGIESPIYLNGTICDRLDLLEYRHISYHSRCLTTKAVNLV
jgi:hypothetical protein